MRRKYIEMNAKLTSYIFDEYVCSGEYSQTDMCENILTLANLVGIGVVGKM